MKQTVQETTEAIAVLGPAGTFCDHAAGKYLDAYQLNWQPVYYPSIDETFHAVGRECRYGLIPIENTLDGYVQRTLDLMLEMDVTAVDEIIIPVQFAMVANVSAPEEIDTLYVQFKASGQCRTFINQLTAARTAIGKTVTIITTENNMESYHRAKEGVLGTAAIVPAYADGSGFSYYERNVTDMNDNYTRFLLVKDISHEAGGQLTRPQREGTMKIPLFISPLVDRPGMLFDILRTFNERRINLVAIMSRPTRKIMGTYHFYMEIDAHTEDLDTILEAAKLIDVKYNLKMMGAYLV